MIRTPCSVFFYEMIIQVWPHEETQEKHTRKKSLIQKGVTAYHTGSQGKVWVRKQIAGARGKLRLQALLGFLRERKARQGEQFRSGSLNNFRGL